MKPTINKINIQKVVMGGKIGTSYAVQIIWNDVDRPSTGCWLVPSISLANRLRDAIESGKVFYLEPKIMKDASNETFVHVTLALSMRRLNSELKKFGF